MPVLVSSEDYFFEDATCTGGVGVEFSKPQPRSPGCHAGGLIRDISNTVIKPGKRGDPHLLSGAERKRMGMYTEMGFIWELMVEHWLRPRMLGRRAHLGVIQQAEIELDGVFMTPDALCIPDRCLEEYKATWMSDRRGEPERFFDKENFWEWGAQSKAYLKGYQQYFGFIDTVRIFVYWVNGNYRDSGPYCRMYTWKFTALEIQQNWDMLIRHKNKIPLGTQLPRAREE